MTNLIILCIQSKGQAGRGNNEEFGLLSLEFDENFCMGGPGIIMSRQTLKRGEISGKLFFEVKFNKLKNFLRFQSHLIFKHVSRISTAHMKTLKLVVVYRSLRVFPARGIMRFVKFYSESFFKIN